MSIRLIGTFCIVDLGPFWKIILMDMSNQLSSPTLRSVSKPFPPAAYIIGAPKCGTTALAHYLSEHPDISFSRPKEPHYYARDLKGLRRCSNDEEYRACFSPKNESVLLMEASVWYLYSETAVAAILAARPDARFIVMLRNPVKMLASLHLQLIHSFDENELDFATAWNLSEKRAKGQAVPPSCRAPSTLIYTRTAAFGHMVGRLFSSVPKDRCMIIFQEEMLHDTAGIYNQVLNFLGIDSDERRDFPRINQAVRSRSRSLQYLIARGRPIRESFSNPIKKLLGVQSLGITKGLGSFNSSKIGAVKISQDMVDRVSSHYASDMEILSKLLERDPSLLAWR